MYTVYIIKNCVINRYYTGYTANLEKRLKEHNSGKTKSLRNRGFYTLVYKEEFENRADAYKRERQIKNYKSGDTFKKLIGEQITERCWSG